MSSPRAGAASWPACLVSWRRERRDRRAWCRTGRSAGVDRAGRADAAVPAVRDGPDRVEPGGTGYQQEPSAKRRRAAVDRGHLRLRAGRVADHDGRAGRPDRPAAPAAGRRGRVRRGLGSCRLRRQRGDADRGARAAGRGGGDARAVHPVADPQHVPGPGPAQDRRWRVDLQLRGGRSGRAADRRACTEWFWWGSVFLLAVPVMALLLVLGPLLLPEFRDPEPRRLDPASAALSLAAVLALIYGLKQLAEGDGPGWMPALAIAGGAAAGAVFAHRQRTLADPLLDLRLFRLPGFKAALGSNLVSFFAGFGVLLFIGQYLQLVLGLSPLAAGLWMLPSSAGVIAGSMLTPVLARRARPAYVLA